MRLGLFATGLLASTLAGCGVGGAPDGVVADCSSQVALPPGVSTDILFVVDDSISMREEQEKVAAQLEAFVTALAEGPVAHDFRIGLATTGVSQNAGGCEPGEPSHYTPFPEESGRLQPATLPGDEGPGPTILSWNDPDLLPRFAALVRRGTSGSGQEMGLEAMRLALTEPLATEQGFLRPGARLLVVVVTDEDDCSDPTGTALTLGPRCEDVSCSSDADCGAEGSYCLPHDGRRVCFPNFCETSEGRALLEPVQRYVDLLQNLDDGTGTGRKRETYFAAIAPIDVETGDAARCISSTDEASGIGVRYLEAAAGMGERGTTASICADDYGAALQEIATLVQAPQVLELEDPPADARLLRVELERADGTEVSCRSGDGFSYEAPTGGAAARITLEGKCRLQHGDQIRIEQICAG